MATSRLPFLYPNLLRSVRSCEPTTYRSIRYPPQRSSARLHTSPQCEQDTTIHQRYGPAAQTHLRPSPGSNADGAKRQPQLPPNDAKKLNGEKHAQEQDSQAVESKDSSKQNEFTSENTDSSSSSSPSTISASSTVIASELPPHAQPDSDSGKAEAEPAGESAAGKEQKEPSPDNLGFVFQLPGDPTASAQAEATSLTPVPGSESQRPPNLTPSPYVHHFDTYGLVKELEKGGFAEEQAILIMKSVRGLLADNLEVARKGLLSKSDFENETYLFRAASSELRNSIQSSRNAEIQAQRSQRAQIQHEVDILNQKMTQELAGLKDDVKEMFNNQTISAKELQRSLDASIQELNYQITVSLNSEGKSQVEGLRWILTRRAALAIATSAIMIIIALRYHSFKQHKEEKAAAAPPPPPEMPSNEPTIPSMPLESIATG